MHPFEFKLAQTPRAEMAAALERFGQEFAALKPEPGCLVALADRAGPLTRQVRLTPAAEFVKAVGKMA